MSTVSTIDPTHTQIEFSVRHMCLATVRGCFDAEIGAAITDPFGLRRRAAKASAVLNRKAFGLHWNQILEAGGLLMSEEVKLRLDVQVTAAESAEAVPA
ncbi:MAG: hypothetical protein EA416_11765 [Trueperaceae bacterium]|nr:MAG: hypothetical protein EA416_11765 [Trueperaceae bacterium]